MSDLRLRISELEGSLRRGRNEDGGWGYQARKASRLEPTSWALLALAASADPPDPSVLSRWPVNDGLLLERRDGSSNYAFHGLALIALRAVRVEHSAKNGVLLAAMQRVKGESLPADENSRQDNSLQGWSWVADTFSWVEPTAWCLLALKLWARTPGAAIERARIDVAERLLVDRCMVTGGWNYGNSNMLGQELKAFVPTTAIALLAMQDRSDLPEVRRSLAFLERRATEERSGTALALALMALRAFGRPLDTIRATLLAQVPTTLAFGNQVAAAMSLYALAGEPHDAIVF